MLRVVLDANVYVRALLSPGGKAGLIVDAWAGERFELLSCSQQFGELNDITQAGALRRLPRASERIEVLIGKLWATATPVLISQPYPEFERDPKDSYVLAMLRDGQVDVLVTEDRDLLDLRMYAGAIIVSVREFLEIIGE